MLLDLASSPDSEATARALGPIIAEEASKVRGLSLLSHDDVRAVLDQEASKAMMGCTDQSCLAELADAMDAGLLISGRLSRDAGGTHILTLSLLNTRAVVTVNRVSQSWQGAAGELPKVARAATALLVFDRSQREPGSIEVVGGPREMRISVDGQDYTDKLAQSRHLSMDVGVHDIQISAPDHLARDVQVVVLSGEELRLDATLEETPLTSNAWFWMGAGTAVLSAVGFTAALFAFTGPATVTTYAQLPNLNVRNIETVKGTTP